MAATRIKKISFEIFYEKNPGSLVHSQSSDILSTSRRGIISRERQRKIHTGQSWFDTPKTIKDTHKSCTTHKTKGSS